MISEKIVQRLMPVTEEERKILEGDNSIDRLLYMDTSSTVINSRKLLIKVSSLP